MLHRYLILLLSLFIAEQSSSQNSFKNSSFNYFSESREHVSVHINKDIFTTAETLWFTAYIDKSVEKSNEESLNLQLGLYNNEGILVDQAVYFIDNGIASGSLLLKQPPSTYFLKIQTNWMRNFSDSRPFIKEIQIIDYFNTAASPLEKQKNTNDFSRNASAPSSIEMIVNTMAPKDIIISFEKLEKNNSKNKDFFLAFHNNIEVELTALEIKGNTKVVKISKDQLTQGIHTLLLLDKEKNVLQEKIIFHLNKFSDKTDLELAVTKKENDSISIKISQERTLYNGSQASVTIVPLESLTTHGSLEIQNTFKNIWTPKNVELFIPTNRQSLANLNKRLAYARNTFNWKQLLKKISKPIFINERGFSISGNVEGWEKTNNGTISVYQRDVGEFETTEIDFNGFFKFANLYLEKGKKLNFSVFKNGVSVSKPKIVFTVNPRTVIDTLSKKTLKNASNLERNIVTPNPIPTPSITTASGIALDEIELVGDSKKEGLTRNKWMANNSIYDGKKITVEDVKKSPMLSSYIRRLGFVTRISKRPGYIFIQARNPIRPRPAVFVDGLPEPEDILDVPLSFIDEVYYENIGILGNVSGSIYIYRKLGAAVGQEIEGVTSYTIDQGYETPQSFFNENISTQFDSFSKKYKTVYWDGNLSFKNSADIEITIARYGLKGVKIILQGVNNHRKFFSLEKEVYFD